MPSVTEIAYCKASNDYKPGPLNESHKVTGLKKSYVGYQTEDSTVLFWVNDWATKDTNDAFDYGPAFDSQAELTVNYVEFENTEGPLGAPITEFVTFALRKGESIADLGLLVQELHKLLPGTLKFHGDSWGLVRGKTNVYHAILGWDTVDAHWDAVSGGPLKEVIDRVKLIADLWLVHAALKPVYESEHA